MSWHTATGSKSCMLHSLAGVFRRFDKAITERYNAVNPPVVLEPMLMPKTLSQDKQGRSGFTNLSRYFLYPPQAKEVIDSELPYVCATAMDTISDRRTEYSTSVGFIEAYGTPKLLPIPSAKLLDSWYRYINGHVYVRGILQHKNVYTQTIWKVSCRKYESTFGNSQTSDFYDFTSDRINGKTCYIRVYDISASPREFIGVFGSIAPTDGQMEDTSEAENSFVTSVRALSGQILQNLPPIIRYDTVSHFGNDGWDGDRRLDEYRSELYDIGHNVRRPVGSNWITEWDTLTNVYGISVKIKNEGNTWEWQSGEPLPSVVPTSREVYTTIVPEKTDIYEAPIKLNLEYYDPPES